MFLQSQIFFFVSIIRREALERFLERKAGFLGENGYNSHRVRKRRLFSSVRRRLPLKKKKATGF
ncbi:hypothetical protein D8B45_01520 [Candidatus Gracilibacteria bacterium]|nr:MAG: hypothetical protein D8B45_01520 [Candidatus Gracilibacteria bacterium]